MHQGDLHGEIGAHGDVLGGEFVVSEEDSGEIGFGADDLPAPGGSEGAAESLYGGGEEGGGGGDVRGDRWASGEDGREGQGNWDFGGEL